MKRGEIEATREGEDTPKLDQVDREDIKATGYIKPVITKEEENPGKKGDTNKDKESGNKYQAKAGVGTNFGQAENETKAKYQTALCLLHPKAGIGTN